MQCFAPGLPISVTLQQPSVTARTYIPCIRLAACDDPLVDCFEHPLEAAMQ